MTRVSVFLTAILAASVGFGDASLHARSMAKLHDAQLQTALSGVWETVRVNRQPLPHTDEVVGSDGFTHAVRLHEMTIRLRPNNRFQAALRYRRAILSKGERINSVPLQTDTWLGTYTLEGARMRFVPEARAEQRVQPFTGVRDGTRITVEFDYQIVTPKRYRLEMSRNDSIL